MRRWAIVITKERTGTSLVVREDRVRAGSDLRVGPASLELANEIRQEPREPQLMCRSVATDGFDPVFEQILDTRLDGIADGSDLRDRPTGRVGDVPVLDGRRHVGALGAAGERYRPVGMQLHLDGQLLRTLPRQVDAHLAHGLDDLGPHLPGGLLAGGLGPQAGRRVALEERLGHLRSPGVVGADEEDVLHARIEAHYIDKCK